MSKMISKDTSGLMLSTLISIKVAGDQRRPITNEAYYLQRTIEHTVIVKKIKYKKN